jgi:hypothetical protein
VRRILLFLFMLASLILGLCAARFNVLAALVAAAVCAVGSAIYGILRDSSLTHSVLVGVVTGLVLPVGYLMGQLVRPSQKRAQPKPKSGV